MRRQHFPVNPEVVAIIRDLPNKLGVMCDVDTHILVERPEAEHWAKKDAARAVAEQIAQKLDWEAAWEGLHRRSWRGECFAFSAKEFYDLCDRIFDAGRQAESADLTRVFALSGAERRGEASTPPDAKETTANGK